MVAPLDGIRVVEVANWLAVPATSALLADMGAEVVKVEPPGGDHYRHTTVYMGFDIPFETNFCFQLDNRGKRSITVALDRPGGPEVVRRLAANADIFLTNLLPQRQARYGLTFEDLSAVNSRLVYANLTGYGSRGPDASRPGFDHAAFWAASGAMGLVGEPDTPPPDSRSGQGDHTTALNLLAAVLAGLRLRDVTGTPQHVETSLQMSGMWTLAADYACTLASGVNPRKVSRLAPRHPVANSYMGSDGRWIQLAMPRPFPGYWPRFCDVVGRPEWAEGPDAATTLAELQARTREWVAELDTIFATRPAAEWGRALDAASVIWAPVPEVTEVVESEQIAEMGWLAEVDHPDFGRFRTLNTPFKVHGSDTGVRGPAPRPGEHSADVLADAGFAPEEIATLAADGTFG